MSHDLTKPGSYNFMSENSSWYIATLQCNQISSNLLICKLCWKVQFPQENIKWNFGISRSDRYCDSTDLMLLVCQVIWQDHAIQWLYWLEPLNLSHHATKSSSHRLCSSADVMVLVYQVMLQHHVTKTSSNFMAGAA